MRILKYLLLLLILFAIGAIVFVATQQGNFKVTKSQVVPVGRSVAFSFVNDYQNWPSWFVPAKRGDAGLAGSGKNATLRWNGEKGEGSATTTLSRENDTIAQYLLWNGIPGTMGWKFSDTGSGTTITASLEGKMGFMEKIRMTFSGGPQQAMENMLEHSLQELSGTLERETRTFHISDVSETWKKSTYYVGQSITSTIENLPRNRRIMRSNLTRFFAKNKLAAYGRPFVQFNYYDPQRKLAKFSVCMPLNHSVYIAQGSDVAAGKLEAFKAVKVTLTGDYSHLRDAYARAEAYIRSNHLARVGSRSLEIYDVGKENNKPPSQWVTSIYIPIAESITAKPVTRPVPTNKLPAPADTETTPAPGTDEIPIP